MPPGGFQRGRRLSSLRLVPFQGVQPDSPRAWQPVSPVARGRLPQSRFAQYAGAPLVRPPLMGLAVSGEAPETPSSVATLLASPVSPLSRHLWHEVLTTLLDTPPSSPRSFQPVEARTVVALPEAVWQVGTFEGHVPGDVQPLTVAGPRRRMGRQGFVEIPTWHREQILARIEAPQRPDVQARTVVGPDPQRAYMEARLRGYAVGGDLPGVEIVGPQPEAPVGAWISAVRARRAHGGAFDLNEAAAVLNVAVRADPDQAVDILMADPIFAGRRAEVLGAMDPVLYQAVVPHLTEQQWIELADEARQQRVQPGGFRPMGRPYQFGDVTRATWRWLTGQER